MATVEPHPDTGYVWKLTKEEWARIEHWVINELLKGKAPVDHWGYRTDRTQRNIEGYAAEFACCLHWGDYFKFEVHSGRGDNGIDMDLDGTTYAVQSRRYREAKDLDRDCAIDSDKIHGEQVADVFVYCITHCDSRRVWIRGICSAEVVGNRRGHTFDTGVTMFYVPAREMDAPPRPVPPMSSDPDSPREPTGDNVASLAAYRADREAQTEPEDGIIEEEGEHEGICPLPLGSNHPEVGHYSTVECPAPPGPPELDGWVQKTRQGTRIYAHPLSGYWYGEEVALLLNAANPFREHY